MSDLPWFPDLDERWKEHAACKGMDTNLFFPERGQNELIRAALAVCDRCTVRQECFDYCHMSGIRVGVWGGLSERGRRRITDKPHKLARGGLAHGTNRGYQAHIRDQSEPCPACREAHRAYQARMKAERRGDAA